MMKIGRIAKITICAALSIFCIALGTFFILRTNSLSIALGTGGYSTDAITTLDCGISQTGREFRVVETTKGDKMVLVFLEKGNMGFWSASYSSGDNLEGATLLSIGWAKTTGFKWFTGEETLSMGSEWHNIYCGNNAIKLIDITVKQLPAGVAMDIRQFGREFSIHVTAYETPDVLNQIDIHAMLLAAGCIEN